MAADPHSDPSYDGPTIKASEATLIVHSTTRIASPASLVFRSLRNVETWKDWNTWTPKVDITYQPPDEDLATAAEINELVRNTSIAGSFDSGLIDGIVGGGALPRSMDGIATPPLKLRRGSAVSAGSTEANSETSDNIAAALSPAKRPSGVSAAQKYAQAAEERRASVASGQEPTPVANQLASDPTVDTTRSDSKSAGRRKSKAQIGGYAPGVAISRAKSATLMQLYGEPSVRLQIHSKFTLNLRMNPQNKNEFSPAHLVVTEVSRPDDPVTEGTGLTALTRSKTHTLSRQALYRIVWCMDSTAASFSTIRTGAALPKSLLSTERVHEIRPIYLGDGSEECEYRTWELEKGPVAKIVKKKYAAFLQQRFEEWGRNLGAFCEAQGGKVDRRDFILEQVAGGVE